MKGFYLVLVLLAMLGAYLTFTFSVNPFKVRHFGVLGKFIEPTYASK